MNVLNGWTVDAFRRSKGNIGKKWVNQIVMSSSFSSSFKWVASFSFSYITTELDLEISYVSDIPIFSYCRTDLVLSSIPLKSVFINRITITTNWLFLPFIIRCSEWCNERFHPEVSCKNVFPKYFAKLRRKHLSWTPF